MSEISRIFDLLEAYPDQNPDREVFAVRSGTSWSHTSLKEYKKNVQCLSSAFIARLQLGDRIATVSNNRPEWNVVDLAAGMSGMVHVPIYPTISIEEFRYILIHSGAKILFVSDKNLHKQLSGLVDEINELQDIYCFDSSADCSNWLELMDDKRNLASPAALRKRAGEVNPDDLFTLI